MQPESSFQEDRSGPAPASPPGVTIRGSQLEPILDRFRTELEQAGIRRLRPDFYLADEWGVDYEDEPNAIGIPAYLANAELTARHAESVGHIEGTSPADILRYLRHEMGHVVNYAYRLYNTDEWVRHFGAFTQPYREEYRPEPFSRRFVWHLPGWYAQKHPDEDWAETFAVWMTPGRDWRAEYKDWPEALAKLTYCDRTMAGLADRDPEAPASDDKSEESSSGAEAEGSAETGGGGGFPPGLEGALRLIFEDAGRPEYGAGTVPRRPAAALIRLLERELMGDVYRWTGHFPEHTRPLLHHLASLAEQLRQVYPEDQERRAVVAVTTLVTALAMNHVYRGTYLPEEGPGSRSSGSVPRPTP
jgi:hypothetical protein